MSQIDWTLGKRAHEQIADHLREAIINGRYKAGQRLPRPDLMAEYGVSHLTAQRATDVLKAEGLVYYRPSQGLLVNDVDTTKMTKSKIRHPQH